MPNLCRNHSDDLILLPCPVPSLFLSCFPHLTAQQLCTRGRGCYNVPQGAVPVQCCTGFHRSVCNVTVPSSTIVLIFVFSNPFLSVSASLRKISLPVLHYLSRFCDDSWAILIHWKTHYYYLWNSCTVSPSFLQYVSQNSFNILSIVI